MNDKVSKRFDTDYDDGSLEIHEIIVDDLIHFRPMCGHCTDNGKVPKITKVKMQKICALIISPKIYLQIIKSEPDTFSSLFLSCDEKSGERIERILGLRFDDGTFPDKEPDGNRYYYFESE